MRKADWTPSIIPCDDQTVYLVADDFGPIGRAWRETDLEAADLETVIQDLMAGEYSSPIRVIGFNTAERWSEDVSEDIAREVPAALRPAADRGAGGPAGFCRSARQRSPATDVAACLRRSDAMVALCRDRDRIGRRRVRCISSARRPARGCAAR
ncbi:hypothetical protein ACE103_30080 [Bradyrhizobium sp. ma5]|uniref:hypothetical protein n=1 Tax=Bradyrhizobium sp. ma5 TaxID=3344828 RepID=UPI0035D51406